MTVGAPALQFWHCQCCGRPIKLPRGRIADHGFRRPNGLGYQVGLCFGSRALPYETSRERIPLLVKIIQEEIDRLFVGIHAMSRTPSKIMVRPAALGRRATFIEPGHDMYRLRQAEWLRKQAAYIKEGEREIDGLQARYDAWIAPAGQEAA